MKLSVPMILISAVMLSSCASPMNNHAEARAPFTSLGHTVMAGEIESLPPCTLEDASDPDQALPCVWDGGTNNTGLSYIINPDLTVAYL